MWAAIDPVAKSWPQRFGCCSQNKRKKNGAKKEAVKSPPTKQRTFTQHSL
jgi:hypothetical protein